MKTTQLEPMTSEQDLAREWTDLVLDREITLGTWAEMMGKLLNIK